LYTSWFGYAPWSLRSVNALGPAIESTRTPLLTPIFVIGALLSLFAAALILRWSRALLLRNGIIAALALWVVLDIRWLADLGAKHELTEDIYAGKPWSERERLVPDQNTALAAEQVRTWLATQPPVRRILVDSDSTYILFRLVYLLLPLDVAPMQQMLNQPANTRLPADALLVFYTSSQWRYDPARGVLADGRRGYAVEPVFESGDLHVYRQRGAKP
jgi:hypothetical protein